MLQVIHYDPDRKARRYVDAISLFNDLKRGAGMLEYANNLMRGLRAFAKETKRFYSCLVFIENNLPRGYSLEASNDGTYAVFCGERDVATFMWDAGPKYDAYTASADELLGRLISEWEKKTSKKEAQKIGMVLQHAQERTA